MGLEAILLTEERGEIKIGREPSFKIILDPIDGTFNALRNIPLFSLSIAVRTLNDEELFGYVSSLSFEDEFHAFKNKGAFRNSKRIKVSEKDEIEKANISLYHDEESPERVVELCKAVNRIRCYGCASLELCYVASGALDAFVDVRGKQRIVDIAAGTLILKEAGGKVTDDRGMDLSGRIEKICVVATNGRLHEKILKLL
jgi:myo-inositol-1(or 4)-monophosphatase